MYHKGIISNLSDFLNFSEFFESSFELFVFGILVETPDVDLRVCTTTTHESIIAKKINNI